MKIKFHSTDGPPHDYLTVGYWFWDEPKNTGTLHIEVAKLPDWRYSLAVFGHEFVEAIYCWMRGITTEECDVFDDKCELEFIAGTRDPRVEPGFDGLCPYRNGHILGSWWEWFIIHVTFASWKKYDTACNKVMGLE